MLILIFSLKNSQVNSNNCGEETNQLRTELSPSVTPERKTNDSRHNYYFSIFVDLLIENKSENDTPGSQTTPVNPPYSSSSPITPVPAQATMIHHYYPLAPHPVPPHPVQQNVLYPHHIPPGPPNGLYPAPKYVSMKKKIIMTLDSIYLVTTIHLKWVSVIHPTLFQVISHMHRFHPFITIQVYLSLIIIHTLMLFCLHHMFRLIQ